MPLGEQFTPELQVVNQTPSTDVCLCLCLSCLCCMWMSLLLDGPGGAPAAWGGCLGCFSCFYPAKLRSWGHPLPRAGGCCSMQGFVLRGWWLRNVEQGAVTPRLLLSPRSCP